MPQGHASASCSLGPERDLARFAAAQAKYGYKVTMCEAHYLPGGCAHGFDIKSKKDGGVYKFDAGPSLWAGMSQPSTNPLRQVMDAVGANVEWKEYDGWGVYFPDGYFRFNVGPADAPGGFEDVLRRFVFNFYMWDDTMGIHEPPQRNLGIITGKSSAAGQKKRGCTV